MIKDDLGNRMKENYENRSKTFLTRRMPVIIRLDGKAFHTFTRGLKKPFDDILVRAMQETAKYLCENIQGCRVAYTQSDEITLLLTDYNKLTTDAWFDYNIQKMCSISSSMATLAFNKIFDLLVREYVYNNGVNFDKDSKEMNLVNTYKDKLFKALFDSRAFNIPKEEVCNCFIWRQQDATRNAIEMVGHANFSSNQLHKVNCNQIQEMLFSAKGINFNELPTHLKRGSCVVKVEDRIGEVTRKKWIIDLDIPIFSKNRDYIERWI